MRYHGIDLHKGSAAISVRNDVGHEVSYQPRVADLSGYVAALGPQDVAALESTTGCFLWAERIQRRGARCVVIDPYRFRIIRDSWHKTDRHDAGALSLALWTSAQSGELVLPEVWQPTPEVRELRRLFAQWQILTTQSRQQKTAERLFQHLVCVQGDSRSLSWVCLLQPHDRWRVIKICFVQ
jgi:transposase